MGTSLDFNKLVNVPVEGIRLLDTVCLSLGKRRRVPFAVVWSQPGVVCSEKVTFDPLTGWPIDLFKKEPLKGQFQGPPTYTHQVWRRSVKGPRRSRGTNKQTDKRCSNYSMMPLLYYLIIWRRGRGVVTKWLIKLKLHTVYSRFLAHPPTTKKNPTLRVSLLCTFYS